MTVGIVCIVIGEPESFLVPPVTQHTKHSVLLKVTLHVPKEARKERVLE
jgi:hypothetical protein